MLARPSSFHPTNNQGLHPFFLSSQKSPFKNVYNDSPCVYLLLSSACQISVPLMLAVMHWYFMSSVKIEFHFIPGCASSTFSFSFFDRDRAESLSQASSQSNLGNQWAAKSLSSAYLSASTCAWTSGLATWESRQSGNRSALHCLYRLGNKNTKLNSSTLILLQI